MINKLTILYFLVVVGLAWSYGTNKVVKPTPRCQTPVSQAACNALCWIHLPYFNNDPFRNGCLDSYGYCWCCDPQLTTSSSSYGSGSSYGYGSGYQAYTCPDPAEINCGNYNCHLVDWWTVDGCSASY